MDAFGGPSDQPAMDVTLPAVAFASLSREGFTPSGDLLFIATADEEVGGEDGFGLVWLCTEHPDAARCDYAINEGGGDRLVLGGSPVYLCGVSEKASAPFVVRVHGRSGHASMPGIADNALAKAAPLIERLAAYRPALRLDDETGALLVRTRAGVERITSGDVQLLRSR